MKATAACPRFSCCGDEAEPITLGAVRAGLYLAWKDTHAIHIEHFSTAAEKMQNPSSSQHPDIAAAEQRHG